MAIIDGVELPDYLDRALERVVEEMPERIVLLLAEADPTVGKGHRPVRANVKVFRQRIKARLAGPLDDLMLEMLALSSFNGDFVKYLSHEDLDLFFDDFLRVFGEEFLLAVVLDSRHEVRALGLRRLNEPTPEVTKEEFRKAADRLCRQHAPLLDHLMWVFEKADLGPPAKAPKNVEVRLPQALEEVEPLRKRIAQLEQELTETRVKSSKLKQLEQKLAHAEQHAHEAEKKLGAEKQRAETFAKQLKTAQTELAAVQQAMAETISSEVEKQLGSQLRSWLAPLRAVEQEAARPSDLLERVSAALEKQAALDRHSGNRRVLRERLQALEEARRRVGEARATALNPLPVLETLEDELREEIERLRSLLGEDRPASPFVQSMLEHINAAAGPEALGRYEAILRDLEDTKALPHEDLRRLYQACHDGMARCYDEHGPKVIAEGEPQDPAVKIRWALSRNRPLFVILDGHNILFGLDDLFSKYYENDLPKALARQELVHTVYRMVSASPAVHAWVFFDGPDARDQKIAANVDVTYSGGTGAEHRADRTILAFLESGTCRTSGASKVVVTSDRDLRARAEQAGAATLSAEAFGALLDSLGLTP